jgi:hypothetical protein
MGLRVNPPRPMTTPDDTHCSRCGGSWRSPTTLDTAAREEIAGILRSQKPMPAIKALRAAGGLSLRDAKAVMIHMTLQPRTCHRCRGSLSGAAVVTCESCRSLNYDW